MLKLALACEKDKEATANLYLVNDPYYGITLKAKDKDGADWYIASIKENGVLKLHEWLPDSLCLSLNGKKHNRINITNE